MGKKLSEMSLEELWQLFPIFLTAHQDCWMDWYREEERLLKGILPQTAEIFHIGSTAVPTISAKPIIDILVLVPENTKLADHKDTIANSGYICMNQADHSISFNKGYTADGFAERVFHLHLKYAGNSDELYFRDYLLEHPDTAKEYEKLKLALWKTYEHNRDAYTNAKTDFVKRCTMQARQLYGQRY